MVLGQLKRSKKVTAIRGLNKNHNHHLKNIFKGAAIRAAAVAGPFQEFYAALVGKGMKQPTARLTLARKIALIGQVDFTSALIRRSFKACPRCRISSALELRNPILEMSWKTEAGQQA